MGHLREVCSLSRGAKFEPLSNSLQVGLRFLQHPLPAPPWAHLTVRFPGFPGERRAYHVPLEYLRGLGLAYLPVVHQLRQVSKKHLYLTTYLLVQATRNYPLSTFGLLGLTTFISDSHMLTLPRYPSS